MDYQHTYADIVDWDEDLQGPMPDTYTTECPKCGDRFDVWHATNYVACACGHVFDPGDYDFRLDANELYG